MSLSASSLLRESSPRMRGTLVCCRRIKTVGLDHPRGCGEHGGPGVELVGVGGSSPRMRGTQVVGQVDGPGRGIIPADSGNTCLQRWMWLGLGDHPRGCGEHTQYPNKASEMWGSSPRMRGTHALVMPCMVEVRIIPADAGNTPFTSDGAVVKRDHPRGCGEHQSLLVAR